MSWIDLEWTPVPGLPTPHPSAPPQRPMLPDSVEQDAAQVESVRVRMVKAMAWCATGIVMVLLFGARSVLAAPETNRWQLGVQLGMLVAPPLIVLCWGLIFLKRRYTTAGATSNQRAHVERFLAWQRDYHAWLEQSRRDYRRHLTPAQRRRLDMSRGLQRKRTPIGPK